MKSFKCTGCGACCRRAGSIPGFPEPVNEDGSCTHLTEDNRCSIYEDRPIECRVNEFWKQKLKDQMSLVDWHKLNHQSCNEMIKEDKMDVSYLINSQ